MEYVTLVDEKDKEVGIMEKLLAHRTGDLHRAISVFVFNSNGDLLLQRRALNKYHSPGLWSNTCCSHPRPGELAIDAAMRRLDEELGINCPLIHQFSFIYKASFDNGLTEHEYDHVFFGVTDDVPQPDTNEVMEWKYANLDDIENDMLANRTAYTYWFRFIFDRIRENRQSA